MGRFKVVIDTDGVAFADAPEHEMRKLLDDVWLAVCRNGLGGICTNKLIDTNGNTCGHYEYKADTLNK
jgi:hypothetical protein